MNTPARPRTSASLLRRPWPLSWHALALSALLAVGGAAALLPITASATSQPPLQPVPSVDLTRYQGLWYQIAYYPNRFQKQCASDTTAQYRSLPWQRVEVTNSCRTPEGTQSQVVGEARLKRPTVLGIPIGAALSSAKLEVRFAPGWLSWVPGVWADYWVIQLANDYRYAVVGEPTREYLWILSRTPTLSAQDDAAIRARLLQQGYDPARLQSEPQGTP
ncbi:MAG: lipocalin [Rubrivivax sp.]|nr:MAG: lipocalin [Rubrivivax sp.]